MANVKETATWENGIYQLETTDPVLGGENGIDNLQARQLGNRTQWLKTEIASAVADIGNLGSSKSDKSVQITAGAGLTGGGTLAGNRTLALGTPGTCSGSTSNWAGSDTHTHALAAATLLAPGIVQLVNNLATADAGKALTAAQGKALADLISGVDGGAFKLRGHLASKNLDDVKGDDNYGVHFCRTNVSAAADLNYPVQLAGVLFVLPTAYQGIQLYVPYISHVLYIRHSQQDGSFSPWRQIGEVVNNLTSSSITAALSAAQGKAIKERLDAAGVGDRAPVANASTGVNDLLADMPATCQDYTLSGNYTNGPLGADAKTYTGIINVSTCMFAAGVSKVLTMRMSDGSVWQNVCNASVWLGWQRIDAIASATAAALAQGLAEKADKATTLAGYGIADGVTNAAMSAAISNLVNGAPGALDTLRELATALGNDANFAATIAAQIRQAAPPGMVVYYGGKIAPAGWLKVNGAAILVSSYQALTDARWVGAAENATAPWWYRCDNPSNPNGSRNVNGLYLVLEDLRGEFIRGWDDGRGVDVGRAIGSHQLDALQQHTHKIATRAQNNGGNAVARGEGGSWGAPSTEQVNTDARTDAETRPRNVALLAIIKI